MGDFLFTIHNHYDRHFLVLNTKLNFTLS
jgi:hypothetical protein